MKCNLLKCHFLGWVIIGPCFTLWIYCVLIAEVESVVTITKAVAATDDIDRMQALSKLVRLQRHWKQVTAWKMRLVHDNTVRLPAIISMDRHFTAVVHNVRTHMHNDYDYWCHLSHLPTVTKHLSYLPIVTTLQLLNNSTGLVLMVVTKKCLSCYREELHPTVTTTLESSSMDSLHYTGHVLTTISAVQNYSLNLEPL